MPKKNLPYVPVEMDPKNKEWFEEYKRWEKTKENYHPQLERFLKYPFTVKPFNTLEDADVEKFRNEMKPSIGKTPFIIYVIKDFKKFLISEKGVKDNFLTNLSELAKLTEPKDSMKAVALNLAQIGYVRKWNKDKGNINDEYIFELFFQLGINKDQLEFCHPIYKNDNEKCFIHDGEKIPYNEKIAELLEKVQNYNALSLSLADVDEYLEKVTKYLRQPELRLYNRKRQIRKTDLKASHDAYFIRCPNCGLTFENSEKNWVLAKIEGGEEFFVVCSQCKGEPQNREESNEN